MEPAVLQTCGQIYLEAIPILYSRNVFHFNHPDLMMWLMIRIGLTNMKLIQSLDIYVPPGADPKSWSNLLRGLPGTTTGLKSAVVRWGGAGDTSFGPGLGKDIAFAQALAGLSKLDMEKLRIEGFYAKPWPAYFRDKFGARVGIEAEDGRQHPPKEDDEDWIRKLKEEDLEDFTKY